MQTIDPTLSTGIADLDRVLRGVNAGDNIVWEIEDLEDYRSLVGHFARGAVSAGRRLVYLRFGAHEPLLGGGDGTAGAAAGRAGHAPTIGATVTGTGLAGRRGGVEVHTFLPEQGFEPFLDGVHQVIRKAGRGVFYVFDCLSDIRADWYTDQMLGNLFLLTCPHLYDLETVAYFALRWGRHTALALSPILETTQLYLEVHRKDSARYIRPVKVQHRYTTSMHMMHRWDGKTVRLVSSSAEVAWALAGSARAFAPGGAAGLPPAGSTTDRDPQTGTWDCQARTLLTRDPALLELCRRWLTMDDLEAVRRRMIGTGLVGGKAVGLLLSRAILRQRAPELSGVLEEHDSFFVGTDVYCTYLVHNGVWWLRERQRDPQTYLEGGEQARRRILTGTFPDHIMVELVRMLDYFGQAPYIVRSSSLLEDGLGSAFAGKYESVFCANQGPRERRVADFLAALRTVYASTMAERALRYRAERGLLDRDEQMALLVMRVSGTLHGRTFYPAASGVGYSYNPYVWSRDIDPHAGVVRLVFGLGTRAVNRVDDDYARLVALNAPLRRPETSFEEVSKVSQRRADYLDLEADRLVSAHFLDLMRVAEDLPLHLFVTHARDWEGGGERPRALTLDGLLGQTLLVKHMRSMLRALEDAYGGPVDVELTVNVDGSGEYRINLVQCRRLHVRGMDTPDLTLPAIRGEDRLLHARGAVVGHSRHIHVDRFVYIEPAAYAELPLSARHELVRVLGQVNRVASREGLEGVVLLGPGRWGTTSPELGVPVTFNDISRAAAICEIVAMREDLVPEVSLGTHFLNDLVEQDTLYAALVPSEAGLDALELFLHASPNRLTEMAPDAARWQEVLRVVDCRDALLPGQRMYLAADSRQQILLLYKAGLS